MSIKVPKLTSDAEVEAFLDQDLSDLDLTQFKPIRFEFEPKESRINMRLPKSQLDAVKAEAKKRGLPYQRFIRELIDRGLESEQTRQRINR